MIPLMAPGMPTSAERARHEVDHCPYQAWCRSCVAGRGKADARFRRESREDGVAHVAAYHAVMGEKVVDDRMSDKCLPVLVLKSRGFSSLISLAPFPVHTTVDLHGLGARQGPAPFAEISPWEISDSNTNVDYAGAARGQFALMRGVRQGCSASGYLFTMAFDPVSPPAVLPLEPQRPWFLQRCACAYAHDFALATASLRKSLPTAFATIDIVTGTPLTAKSEIGSSTGTWLSCNFPIGSAPTFPPSIFCRSATMLGILASRLGPAQTTTDGSKPEMSSLVSVLAFAALRLVSFKIYSLSVLAFVGSVAEPETATIAAENLALQRLKAGPFHALLAALLRLGNTHGLKIDVDGIQLTSKASRFRVASRSNVLSARMARVRAAKDHRQKIHSSAAHFTATDFRIVNAMDSLQSLRNLPFHKMQSGAAAVLRQSGNILDIASATCSRSNRALGFVSQHRVHSLMKGLCRAANSCKASLIVGALRVAG